MRKFLPKIFLAVIFWILFILVIFTVPYPETVSDIGILQFLSFSLPLILATTSTIYIFLKNIYVCFSIALGIALLLFLKALAILNIVTMGLILVSITLLISYFIKQKKNRLTPIQSGLTKLPKIPKLTRLRRDL